MIQRKEIDAIKITIEHLRDLFTGRPDYQSANWEQRFAMRTLERHLDAIEDGIYEEVD